MHMYVEHLVVALALLHHILVDVVKHGDEQVDEENQPEEEVGVHEYGREEGAVGRAGHLPGVIVAKRGPKGREEGPRGRDVKVEVL